MALSEEPEQRARAVTAAAVAAVREPATIVTAPAAPVTTTIHTATTTAAATAAISLQQPQQALDLDEINRSMTFVPSESCTVSCGTVCVDPKAFKVLLIFNRKLGIYQLPKGRKNIGEDLQAAALRETFEETGVAATLFPLKIRTRSTAGPGSTPATAATAATAAAAAAAAAAATNLNRGAAVAEERRKQQHDLLASTCVAEAEAGAETADEDEDPKVTRDLFNTEFVGMVQYPDPQSATPATLKTVFFFAARADSAAPLRPSGALEAHEDLRAEWVPIQQAVLLLRFSPEGAAVWKVRMDMKRSGVS